MIRDCPNSGTDKSRQNERAVIGRVHAIVGHDVTRIREVARTVMAGIATTRRERPREAMALATEAIRRPVATYNGSLQGIRDRPR